MKQLARTAVYWPGIDAAIEMASQRCDSCGKHQSKPPKPPVHPWMLSENPWSRLHLDHAISFMGKDWLVIMDAYTKYPCIHPTSSTSTRATLDLLEEDVAHFGFPHRWSPIMCRPLLLKNSSTGARNVDHAPDRSTISPSYQQSSRTLGADFQASTEKVFSVPETCSSGIPDAVSENTNILWFLSE